MKAKQILADVSLLLVTIIWGTGFAFTKLVLDEGVSPYMILAYRGLFALLAMTPFVYKHIKSVTKTDLILGFILGTLLFLAFAFQTVGADITAPSKNAFLTTLNVIFVPFIMMLFFRHKISILSLLAALVALTGTGLMTLEEKLLPLLLGNTSNTGFEINLGDIYTIICAVFWALHMIATSYFVKKSSVIKLTYIQFIPTFLFAFLLGILLDKSSVTLEVMPFASILYMSLFGMVLGFGVQTWAMNYSSPQKTSVIFTFEGVFGALFSVLIYHEKLSVWGILGGVLIFLAVLISETSSYVTRYKIRRLELKGA